MNDEERNIETSTSGTSAAAAPSDTMKHPDTVSIESSHFVRAKDADSDNISAKDADGNFGDLGDNSNVPSMGLLRLFYFFLVEFGLMAWGGPVAQIALIKEKLVVQRQWITIARFQRVYAVYQILPGPEATELCMFFGCLVGGRLGGMVAGLAFILPGFVLLLILSYVYTIVGLDNIYFNACFRAIQPLVAAMVFKAVLKLAEHTFFTPDKKINYALFGLAILAVLQSILHINYFITLAVFGLVYTAYDRRWYWLAGTLLGLNYLVYGLYAGFKGMPGPTAIAIGLAPVPDLPHLLLLGFVSGCLSFGGAYTAIPFVQAEAVTLGKWLANRVFLDGIALGNVIPAPLVMFATFVGFQGGHIDGGYGTAVAGAVLMTIGIFLPCFVFTILGQPILEKVCRNKTTASFFDGITGTVIGIIFLTALDMLKAAIVHTPTGPVDSVTMVTLASQNAISAIIFMASFWILMTVNHKYTAIVLVIIAAMSGQFLFISDM